MMKRAIVLIGIFAGALLIITPTLSAAPDVFASTSGSSIQDLFNALITAGQGDDGSGESGETGDEDGRSSLDVFGIKGIQKGLITVDKNIFYATDTLEVGVIIPQELTAFWDGEAEAYVMIRMVDGSLLSPVQVRVSEQTPDETRTFISLDLSDTSLTEGEYQIALVLVNAGGDATDLTDWYDGFRGLIGATSFEVRTACEEDDADCDGLTEDTDLAVDSSSVTLDEDGVTIVTISGGSDSYTAVSDNVNVATVNLLGYYAIIAGVGAGDAVITVTDTDGNTVEIAVSVMTRD